MNKIKTLWKMEWLKLKRDTIPTLGYIDFQIDEIDGVFRAADSKGVDLNWIVSIIEKNREFFEYVVRAGVTQVFEESETSINWRKVWEREETSHPTQPGNFYLSSCTSWFTCPLRSNSSDVQPVSKLHNVDAVGIELSYSSGNFQPGTVCYFFPRSAVVEPVV